MMEIPKLMNRRPISSIILECGNLILNWLYSVPRTRGSQQTRQNSRDKNTQYILGCPQRDLQGFSEVTWEKIQYPAPLRVGCSIRITLTILYNNTDNGNTDFCWLAWERNCSMMFMEPLLFIFSIKVNIWSQKICRATIRGFMFACFVFRNSHHGGKDWEKFF